ncbi:MAG: SAM-dependent methyltransferase [Desulforhabdus sp.]|jgi:SAM-dependent methyltransferase|nr:SAM-dependent methyltransferase [Desulforhabdus sp.]
MWLGLSIFLLSGAALAYEVLLMRLVSIIQWHHFAYMIISLALLGYGASGTFIALFQHRLLARFYRAFAINCLLFGLTALSGFLLTNRIPLNPLEVLWDGKQLLFFWVIYLLLALPFFFAANCIGLSLALFKDQIHRIYYFDLIGAGAGALFVVVLLTLFYPVTCLLVLASIGFIAAAPLCLTTASKKTLLGAAILISCAVLLPLSFPRGWLGLNISQYKGLSMAMRVPQARILTERSSPLGWLAVVDSPAVPFRYAPGMSLNCLQEPPPQLGIFTDGDSLNPITRLADNGSSLEYLDCVSSALPYHLLEKPAVLVLGAGGGTDVLMALHHQVGSIVAVELDPQTVALVGQSFADFAGHLYSRSDVEVFTAEARGFVRSGKERYDLIVVSLLDSFSASTAGGYALSETYLYTVEAMQEYIAHLKPGGILAITRWLKIPPRDSLKLFATALQALERSGQERPEQSLALIRSWKTTTLLVKNGELTLEQVDAIRSFCHRRSFDVVYFPGIESSEVNRFNLLDEPYFHTGVMALLGPQRKGFIDRYKFYITPATDDRPYFFHFFKWRILPEVIALKGQGGPSLMEWTYPVLISTLLQALIAGAALILIPLRFLAVPKDGYRERGRIATYFVSLGLAFLFIEIAFIQKLILLLSHPVYAAAVVLCAFLVFAGLGSNFSRRLSDLVSSGQGPRSRSPITIAVTGIIVISAAYLAVFPMLFRYCMTLPFLLKVIIAISLIAPLAFCMGIPFPLGLSRVAEKMPDLIPWAWGINGCASVVSAVLATVLAIHLGFNVVVATAALLYALAAFCFRNYPD